MKISGWNRVLITLSAVWVLWSILTVFVHYPSITPQFAAGAPSFFFDLIATGNSTHPFRIVTHFWAIAGYIIVPLLFLWTLATVARWIRRGFRQGAA